MSNLHLKIRAVRLFRRLSQAETADQAHMHLKTYQRKEAGYSAISEQDLILLTEPFQCSVEDLRNFDLENNTFLKQEMALIRALEVENKLLKSELSFLRQLIEKLTANFSGPGKKVWFETATAQNKG